MHTDLHANIIQFNKYTSIQAVSVGTLCGNHDIVNLFAPTLCFPRPVCLLHVDQEEGLFLSLVWQEGFCNQLGQVCAVEDYRSSSSPAPFRTFQTSRHNRMCSRAWVSHSVWFRKEETIYAFSTQNCFFTIFARQGGRDRSSYLLRRPLNAIFWCSVSIYKSILVPRFLETKLKKSPGKRNCLEILL